MGGGRLLEVVVHGASSTVLDSFFFLTSGIIKDVDSASVTCDEKR